MEILELRQIKRTQEELYYRRKFSAEAAVSVPTSTLELPILFTIETGPLGNKEVEITFLKAPDYPLIPIKNALSQMILTMDLEGKLP
ncbi:hypothetical protein HRQ91_06830 [Treponema parvum]|uniref:Uncharacterized protein n=1 Tax=Treponema parvum TaxID=138851 RepID=A0A975IEM1_9SPIR|nr:hypothetical protein [Treponema parvum]QTQ14190.1 hypothetical protein HRQ91_06830 [Treponema parvum]